MNKYKTDVLVIWTQNGNFSSFLDILPPFQSQSKQVTKWLNRVQNVTLMAILCGSGNFLVAACLKSDSEFFYEKKAEQFGPSLTPRLGALRLAFD